MKFDLIILIDDDGPTNFLHQLMIEEAEAADNLMVCNNVVDAEAEIEKQQQSAQDQNSVIFLDINLPRFTGFELIERNQEHFKTLKSKGFKVILLSTSQNPVDIEKAKNYPTIDLFWEKPIDGEKLEKLRSMYLVESNG